MNRNCRPPKQCVGLMMKYTNISIFLKQKVTIRWTKTYKYLTIPCKQMWRKKLPWDIP